MLPARDAPRALVFLAVEQEAFQAPDPQRDVQQFCSCERAGSKSSGASSSLSTGTIKVYLHKIYEKLIIGLYEKILGEARGC
jgi:hypothetical protein